jgi:hypothetical protein
MDGDFTGSIRQFETASLGTAAHNHRYFIKVIYAICFPEQSTSHTGEKIETSKIPIIMIIFPHPT